MRALHPDGALRLKRRTAWPSAHAHEVACRVARESHRRQTGSRCQIFGLLRSSRALGKRAEPIGRESCRDRVFTYVSISVSDLSLKKKKQSYIMIVLEDQDVYRRL